MDSSRCWSCRFKGGRCLNDWRSGGWLGIVVCSRFGGISRDFCEESREEHGVLIKESVGVDMEDALGIGVPKIFEGASVEVTEGEA